MGAIGAGRGEVGAAAGLAHWVIAAVAQKMAQLETAAAFSRGGLKRADRAELAAHRKGPKLQDRLAKGGLANELHGAGGEPPGRRIGALGSSGIAAVEPDRAAETIRKIAAGEAMGIGGLEFAKEGLLSPISVNTRKDNSSERGVGRQRIGVP